MLGCNVVVGISVFDAYRSVCSVLGRLCPRLVPSPLWGYSLSSLARLSPVLAEVVCEDCGGVVGELLGYWKSIPRGGACSVCGALGARDVDEEWVYVVYEGERPLPQLPDMRDPMSRARYSGEAILLGVRLLCGKCHLSKHQGYARVTGKGREALEHLARVNDVSVGEAERLVKKAFEVWRELSKIDSWKIRVCELPGLREDLRRRTEKFLNEMFGLGYSIFRGWFWYMSKDNVVNVKRMAISETIALLESLSPAENIIKALVNEVGSRLKENNVHVLERELSYALNLQMEDVNKILKAISSPEEHAFTLLAISRLFVGKWMVFAKEEHLNTIIPEVVEKLREERLDYELKTPASRRRGDLYPVIVYVPSYLATSLVSRVGGIVKMVAEELGLRKPIYFKPDVFTEKGIYSGKSTIKPYIYLLK